MFTITFDLIDQYSCKCTCMMEKLTCARYKSGSFCEVQNNINIIRYNDKIVIPDKLQKYVVKWYHIYLIHTVWDIIEVMNIQHLN